MTAFWRDGDTQSEGGVRTPKHPHTKRGGENATFARLTKSKSAMGFGKGLRTELQKTLFRNCYIVFSVLCRCIRKIRTHKYDVERTNAFYRNWQIGRQSNCVCINFDSVRAAACGEHRTRTCMPAATYNQPPKHRCRASHSQSRSQE